jgi:hypothetical protein
LCMMTVVNTLLSEGIAGGKLGDIR